MMFLAPRYYLRICPRDDHVKSSLTKKRPVISSVSELF